MKTDKNSTQLIDDLFDNTTDVEQILALVRKEKSVRRKRRTFITSSAVLLMVAGFYIGANKLTTPSVTIAKNEDFSVLRFINDEQLFELLGDQPLAIMQGADNTKRLVLVEQTPDGDQIRWL